MQTQRKYSLAALLAVGMVIAIEAQPIPAENFDIVKNFDARLLETNKLSVPPTLPPLDTTSKRQRYEIAPRPLMLTYPAPQLRPLGMKAVKEAKPNNGYVKFGAGLPGAILGEGGYYIGGSDKFDGKLWVRHHRLNNDKKIENQRFFDTDALAQANIYFSEALAAEAHVGYSFDRVHFFGYDRENASFSDERTRQDFKTFNIGGRLYSAAQNDADFTFNIAPSLYILTDYYANKETGAVVDLDATKWFAEKHPLRLRLAVDLTKFTDTVTTTLNNIYFQPSFAFHHEIFKLKIGANIVSHRDEFTVFPDAELGLRIIGDGVQLFAGATGDLRKNTFRTMSAYNPFVDIRASQLRNTHYMNFYGGVRGNFGWLDYTGQAGYGRARDLALFQAFAPLDSITRFRTVYDTAAIVNLQGTVKVKITESVTLIGTLSQNVFDLNNEQAPWGLPRTEGNFGAIVSLLDKRAKVRGDLYIADGIPFNGRDGLRTRTQALFDLNLGGSYHFTDNIGVFADVNNLLNIRRQRWIDYPMFGMNFVAGITARF